MNITIRFRRLPAPGFWAAAAITLIETSAAYAADLARVSINDDWRFIHNDPAGITDNLAYPRPARSGSGEDAVVTNAPAPTSGIARFILPTGNPFIADPAKRYPRPRQLRRRHSVCESLL